LGLTIVTKIIEKHKGRVTVESALGQGSTFSFFLPTGNPYEEVDPLNDDSAEASLTASEENALAKPNVASHELAS